jgi:uncharacterized damage-inducible protein DinB
VPPLAPWFERRFDFPVDPSRYPELLLRLRAAPSVLEALLRDSPPELRLRRTEGKWSAQEHAGHLVDLDALWLRRISEFTGGAIALSPADLTNRRTTEANHNVQPPERILAAFRQSRGEILAELDRIAEPLPTHTLLHPRLRTPMRLLDHLCFVAEHDDHHLAHIRNLTR